MIDYLPRRIRHYSHTGGAVWTFGRRGAGPDELADPRDLKRTPSGDLIIYDNGNARLTRLGADGRPMARTRMPPEAPSAREIVPVTDSSVLLVTSTHPSVPLAILELSKPSVTRRPFPWREFEKLDYLAAQVITTSDPTNGRWAMAFRLGDGFFVHSDTVSTGLHGRFVEYVPFPDVNIERKGGTVITSHRGMAIDAAVSITLSPERLYVLFGGTSNRRGRVVDSYSLEDGSYVGSYLFPRAVFEIAWYDGGLYTLSENPFPELGFWRIPDTPLP